MKIKVFLPKLLALLCIPGALAQNGHKTVESAQNNDNDRPIVTIKRQAKRNYVVGTVLIKASPENVWSVLVDYKNAPEIFKNLKMCEVIGERGSTKLVRQLVHPGGPIEFDYVVALNEYKPRFIQWYRQSGSLKEFTGSWDLEPTATGDRTKATYSVFIDGGVLLPPWLLAWQLKNYMPDMLNSLKRKVESQNKALEPASAHPEKTELKPSFIQTDTAFPKEKLPPAITSYGFRRT